MATPFFTSVSYLYFTAPFSGDRITHLLEILNHSNLYICVYTHTHTHTHREREREHCVNFSTAVHQKKNYWNPKALSYKTLLNLY